MTSPSDAEHDEERPRECIGLSAEDNKLKSPTQEPRQAAPFPPMLSVAYWGFSTRRKRIENHVWAVAESLGSVDGHECHNWGGILRSLDENLTEELDSERLLEN